MKIEKLIISVSAAIGISLAAISQPRIRVIVDNDFGGDPDGLFQLAHQALSPTCEIRGIICSNNQRGGHFKDYTAENAEREARTLLGMLGIEGILLVRSIEGEMESMETPGENAGAGKTDRYAQMMAASCGGSPDEKADEYTHRSPVTHLKNAKNVPVYIGTGIHDGYKGSVPVCHAMWGFNMLADEKDRIPDDVIREIVETQAIPDAWLFDGSDPDYVQRIHMRTTSGNVRLTLFEGAHDILPSQGLNWLSNQRKGVGAKWDIAPLSPEWPKERWGLTK